MAEIGARTRPRVIAFDVIGTVFEMEPLRSGVIALGLPGAALEGWTAAANRDAASMAAAGDYRPFAQVQAAALDAVLAEQKLTPPAAARQALLGGMADLSPRPDAREAFGIAVDADVRVMALTNGSDEATRKLLEGAGLLHLVAEIVSTDEVRLAKPRPEVYAHACEIAQVRPDEFALVAAHPWDIQGAVAAGLTAAYLNADRPYSPVMRRPLIEAETLSGCVQDLLAL